jgi:hypothetical protein
MLVLPSPKAQLHGDKRPGANVRDLRVQILAVDTGTANDALAAEKTMIGPVTDAATT